MQEKIIIDTKDNKKIYGVLDQAQNSNKLIVFVHGLTGHKNEHIFYNAGKFFPAKGFSVFRFDLYSDEPGGRKLHECDISTHSEDLNLVLEHFKEKYEEIFLVGHSLGGPTVLGADLSFVKRIVLWDPSGRLNPKIDGEWYEYNEGLDCYVVKWSVHHLIGKKMIAEWESVDYQKWTENCFSPLKVICAGDGVLKNKWEKFVKEFKVETEYKQISSAGHCFDEEGAEEQLFQETLNWFSF